MIALLTLTPCEVSYCDLPEITEEALTRELVADVGPFYKQYRCILGFVAQTCYVYMHLLFCPRSFPSRRAEKELRVAVHM